jgi:hypothetical protein
MPWAVATEAADGGVFSGVVPADEGHASSGAEDEDE